MAYNEFLGHAQRLAHKSGRSIPHHSALSGQSIKDFAKRRESESSKNSPLSSKGFGSQINPYEDKSPTGLSASSPVAFGSRENRYEEKVPLGPPRILSGSGSDFHFINKHGKVLEASNLFYIQQAEGYFQYAPTFEQLDRVARDHYLPKAKANFEAKEHEIDDGQNWRMGGLMPMLVAMTAGNFLVVSTNMRANYQYINTVISDNVVALIRPASAQAQRIFEKGPFAGGKHQHKCRCGENGCWGAHFRRLREGKSYADMRNRKYRSLLAQQGIQAVVYYVKSGNPIPACDPNESQKASSENDWDCRQFGELFYVTDHHRVQKTRRQMIQHEVEAEASYSNAS